MTRVDLRIEKNLKFFTTGLTERSGWSMGEVVRQLGWLGLEVKRYGGFEIRGPAGLFRRPLAIAKLNFDGGDERLTVWIDDSLAEELEKEFGGGLRSALRQVLRLAALTINLKAWR